MPIQSHVHRAHPDLPALVLVHGLGSAGNIWKMILKGLENSFTVYSLDLPGHGTAGLNSGEELDPKSLARMIVEYMEIEHGVTEFHVAGNSLGGWISLELAALFPERAISVTALAPAGLWEGGPVTKYPPIMSARLISKVARYFLRIAFKLPPLKAFGYKKITHLWRELSFESCRDSAIAMATSKGFIPMWRGLRFKNFSSNIQERVRIAIVFGDHDILLPDPDAQVKDKLPSHAKWVVVDNCAHVIMWNYPELTVDLIKENALV